MKREAGANPARTRHRDSKVYDFLNFMFKNVYQSISRETCLSLYMGYPSHEELVVRRIEFAVERGKLTFCAFLHRMNYQARASARAFSFDRKNLSNKNRSAMDATDAQMN